MDLRMNLTDSANPEELQLVAASGTLFRLLGVNAALGRTFDDEDDRVGADLVILLGDSFWRRRFGADPSVVGRSLELDGRSYRVAGVLPSGFTVLPPSSVFPASVDAWVPLKPHLPTRQRDARFLHALARLAPGRSLADAQHDMSGLSAIYTGEYPQTYRPSAWSFTVVPFQAEVVREARPVLLALSAIVAIVFATACVNVANLLLARGERRRRELVLRIALGQGASCSCSSRKRSCSQARAAVLGSGSRSSCPSPSRRSIRPPCRVLRRRPSMGGCSRS